MLIRILVCLALGLPGCDTPKPPTDKGVEKKKADPKAAAKVAEKKAPEKKAAEDPPAEHKEPLPAVVAFDGFPGNEELAGFKLKWKGGKAKVEVRDKPGDGKVLGEVGFPKGAKVEHEASRVLVSKPRPITLEKALVIDGGSRYDVAKREVADASKKLELAKGDKIAFYHYEGEGSSYVGFDGAIYLTAHTEEMGDESLKDGYTWWVKIGGETPGWVEVDTKQFKVQPVDLGGD